MKPEGGKDMGTFSSSSARVERLLHQSLHQQRRVLNLQVHDFNETERHVSVALALGTQPTSSALWLGRQPYDTYAAFFHCVSALAQI